MPPEPLIHQIRYRTPRLIPPIGTSSVPGAPISRSHSLDRARSILFARKLLTQQGTGTWALSLARRHPYADVIGVECVSCPTPCRFEADSLLSCSINWSNFKPSPLPHGNADFYTVGEFISISSGTHS